MVSGSIPGVPSIDKARLADTVRTKDLRNAASDAAGPGGWLFLRSCWLWRWLDAAAQTPARPLRQAGLPAEEAFAAAVLFRILTFCIPAGEGFFTMRWLTTHDYI